MINKILTILLFLSISNSFANEELVQISHHIKKNEKNNFLFTKAKSTARTTAISLPFFEDFYQPEIFPNPTLWQDNFVYINADFPEHAVTVGVATFDGTDAIGNPYSLIQNATGYTDKLTSVPIDLNGLTTDSLVFFSFYYLAGNYGEIPDRRTDYFKVDFLDSTNTWKEVWRKSPDTSIHKMTQVFLKVDSTFLHGNFQFRFYSYGSLTGMNDTWHIDYVRLDKNRDTASDKNIKEMAYQFLPKSILKEYYVMPYRQFDSTDLKDSISVYVINNFTQPLTDIIDSFRATIVNTSSVIASFTGASRDLDSSTIYQIKYPKFSIPTTLTDDTVTIKIDYSFITSAEASLSSAVQANNAVKHNQVFSNFLAYDDATPERGYRVYDIEFYKIAQKFKLKKPDTLQAIKLKFVPVDLDNKSAKFSICIWKNIVRNTRYDATNIIYQESNLTIDKLKKEFGFDTLNGYYFAPIKAQFVKNGATFPLLLSDSFYIGVIVDSIKALTLGFDRNNIQSNKIFYVDKLDKWTESTLPGSIIMNPVLGKPLPNSLVPVINTTAKSYEIKIFPNPTKYNLSIEGIKENSLIQIYTLNGQQVSELKLNEDAIISVEQLPAATYLLRIINLKTNQFGISKFIKSE